MPLSQRVTFQAVLEKGSRLQIPKLFRWQFKMETDQVLNVTVNVFGYWVNKEHFLAKMDKQARIFVPKLALSMLAKGHESSLDGSVFEVTLEPA